MGGGASRSSNLRPVSTKPPPGLRRLPSRPPPPLRMLATTTHLAPPSQVDLCGTFQIQQGALCIKGAVKPTVMCIFMSCAATPAPVEKLERNGKETEKEEEKEKEDGPAASDKERGKEKERDEGREVENNRTADSEDVGLLHSYH